MSKSYTTPYQQTPIVDNKMSYLVKPILKKSLDDKEYVIESKYHHRPDKLAFDLYGDANYLFVFQLRNMDVIKDYIFDFTAGTTIFLPSKRAVESMSYGN